MIFNLLTENEEHYVPSQILMTIFGLHASVIFRPQHMWFLAHLQVLLITKPSGQFAKLIVYFIPTE